jgi:hypothetical protein
MKRLVVCLLLFGSLLYPAMQKSKKNKPPDLELVEATCYRSQDDVALDGSVKNTSEKPIAGIILLFDFMAPGNQVVVTKKIALDVGTLGEGDTAEFHVRVTAPPRSVHFRVNAEDAAGRELRVAKNGPHPIE